MQCSIGFFNDIPMAVLFVTVAGGYAIGKLRVGPIGLGGVCGTLIVALLVGQTGCHMHGELKEVAFALFIFAMGYSGGPQFFANLNRSSLRFMLLPLIEAVAVLSIVLAATHFLHFDVGTAAGLAAGAATESAVVGTAAEALKHLGVSDAEAARLESNIATAYTLTYLVGLVSIVFFTSQLAPVLLRLNLREASHELAKRMEAASDDDVASQPALPRLVGRAYRVDGAAGLTVGELELGIGGRTTVMGLFRGNESIEPAADQLIERGDVLALIGVREKLVRAGELVGAEVLPPSVHADVLQLDERHVVINKPGINGRTLGDLGRSAAQQRLRAVWIQQIVRSGMSLPITRATRLQNGDRVTLVGTDPALATAAGNLGTELRHTDATELVFLCIGILAGLAIGSLSVTVGGIPVSLGSGGGALLSGLLFGWLSFKRPGIGDMPPAAVQLLKDLGLAVFVACVGLSAGPDAIVLIKEHGAMLPLIGLAVSLVPACLSLWIGHQFLKIEGPLLVGAIAGQHVSTPAISAILAASQSSVPLLGYTVTYAIANVMLPVLGPIIVALAYRVG
ncbi:aspartate-alanine antiporter [Cupriavidus pauculus]|uniref:aspartate-alanine antiporter n=1 Tax=Cupriavidus pauculus TaxID=82633 RepID=UPI0007844E61|nr:aspartate-alanine antiporter [Cupriavidus pauculus]MBY4730349.1 aspartate-alanine antiporter [Cupriavidus pauculus]